MKKIAKGIALALALFWTAALPWSKAAEAQAMLRDAETEDFLWEITMPLIEAAGLDPNAVNIYLIGDPSLNAFVALGQNIFIHSGLLMAADTANEVQGVLAHEIGHITGAHLRRNEGQESALGIMLTSMLLGVAAIAAGAPDAGAGLIIGGQTAAQRTYLSFNRVQESQADQAAVRYLASADISGTGFVSFFEKVRDQELLMGVTQDPYVRTHPITSERINSVETQLMALPEWEQPLNPDWEARFKRVKAKLAGFTNRPHVTFTDYPPEDTSVNARYARIYAYNKDLRWDQAIVEGKSLVEEFPNDPYFNEITGQMLVENGRVREALPYYRTAVREEPNEPLILSYLGHALVALEEKSVEEEAIAVLEKATRLDPYNDFAWLQLATVRARRDQIGEAALATAEYFVLRRQYRDAVTQARIATEKLPAGSPKWIRAQDLLNFTSVEAERMAAEERRQRRR